MLYGERMDRFIWLFKKYYIHGYIDWGDILILFILLILPLVIKPFAESSFKLHLGYFLFILFFTAMLTDSCPSEGENGIISAMFLAFPIGYSIYCVRTKKSEKILPIVVLIVFSVLISLAILNSLLLL